LSEDINKNIEKKITLSITSLENKVNSLLDVIGKVNNSISALEKRMKSIEPPKDVEKDIERIMDNKLHEMFYITKKMLAEVESKNDLLDIFRENMEDIVENHYDLYKKFKYIKDDMEDMVYDKGSQRSGRRR
jgi:predicted RNase H-like nuclease (RuvC/YqgF family)